eukprot:11228354-Lingulodinium_polyedra.AAC.1
MLQPILLMHRAIAARGPLARLQDLTSSALALPHLLVSSRMDRWGPGRSFPALQTSACQARMGATSSSAPGCPCTASFAVREEPPAR